MVKPERREFQPAGAANATTARRNGHTLGVLEGGHPAAIVGTRAEAGGSEVTQVSGQIMDSLLGHHKNPSVLL